MCLQQVAFTSSHIPEKQTMYVLFFLNLPSETIEFLICNIMQLINLFLCCTQSHGRCLRLQTRFQVLNKIAELTVSYTWISFSMKCLVTSPQWCPVRHKEECPCPQKPRQNVEESVFIKRFQASQNAIRTFLRFMSVDRLFMGAGAYPRGQRFKLCAFLAEKNYTHS